MGNVGTMKILSKRNAVIGWTALLVARWYAKRRVHGSGTRVRFGR
jgi:hypothetical protein